MTVTGEIHVPDYSWADRDDWETAWQPLIGNIGRDYAAGEATTGVDAIEKGMVRRYLEPLEFDCPLHFDEASAKLHGYEGIIAPYSSLAVWSSIGMWNPGDPPIYVRADRNAQPVVRRPYPRPGPDTDSQLATDVVSDFLRPLVVGDRISVRGRKLVSVTPKQTTVGRGAFLSWESDIIDQEERVCARISFGVYDYVAGTWNSQNRDGKNHG